jgi:ribosomal RNA-processing protein 8
MATKLFKESDSWGESSGQGEEVTFCFKKTKKAKVEKAKKSKSEKNHKFDENDVDPNAGRFVRAPKFIEQEGNSQETPSKKKKNKRKRKHDEVGVAESSDQETPEKKKKVENIQNGVKPPVNYSDKLRESLKGSRFRFLNEQMYTQSGEDSLKTFQEDPTAFDAYHEGYRHQIAQWPMNPLDRIIKNIKKL